VVSNPTSAVYVRFCAARITNLDNGPPHSRIAISCPKVGPLLSVCVAIPAWRDTTWRCTRPGFAL
jgi:hypothetical protein